MEDIVNLITNNGIGVICVAYLIYFQSTTMKQILETLTNMNARLSIIETTISSKNKKKEVD